MRPGEDSVRGDSLSVESTVFTSRGGDRRGLVNYRGGGGGASANAYLKILGEKKKALRLLQEKDTSSKIGKDL